MKKFYSFVYLVILSFGFYFINWIISSFLTLVLAQVISGDVAFMGFPVGLFQAFWDMLLINALIFFPLFLILTFKTFNKITNKFSLARLHKFVILLVSGAILSLTFTAYPIEILISTININKANNDLKVTAIITDEKITERMQTVYRNSFKVSTYHYTLVINNKTNKTYTVSVEVVPGKYEDKYMFDNPMGGMGVRKIIPGENILEGEYEATHIPTQSTYPLSQQIPISIRLFDIPNNLDKTIYIYSSLPAWRNVFL